MNDRVFPDLHPAGGAVILRRTPLVEDGIKSLSESEQERGEVLVLGPGALTRDGRTRVPMSVEPGQTVRWLFKAEAASFLHRSHSLVMVADRDLKMVEEGGELRALHDFVIFRKVTREFRPYGRDGKVVVPESSAEAQQFGLAVSVGPGRFTEDGASRLPTSVKPGELFRFMSTYGAPSFWHKGIKYHVIKDEAVTMIVDPEPASAEERAS